jgi:predicted NBD/HSP70 family sugar kinase
MRERLWMAVTPGAQRTRVVVVNEAGKNVVLARLPHDPSHPQALERLSEALALWCGRSVRVVLAVEGPEAFCSTRRWLATFEHLTGRRLVEIEFADALPLPPDEEGFADVRRILLLRMARG